MWLWGPSRNYRDPLLPATGSTERTDGSRSMLSTTICATNSTQKERQYPWVLPINEEVASPWMLPKEVTTIPTQDFNSTANCTVFSICVHRTCLVHLSLNMKIKISQIVPIIDKVIVIANLLLCFVYYTCTFIISFTFIRVVIILIYAYLQE